MKQSNAILRHRNRPLHNDREEPTTRTNTLRCDAYTHTLRSQPHGSSDSNHTQRCTTSPTRRVDGEGDGVSSTLSERGQGGHTEEVGPHPDVSGRQTGGLGVICTAGPKTHSGRVGRVVTHTDTF